MLIFAVMLPKTWGSAWHRSSLRPVDGPERIAGYYSPSAASFEKDTLPLALARRLPH